MEVCELCQLETDALCDECGLCASCCDCRPVLELEELAWDLSDMEDEGYFWERGN